MGEKEWIPTNRIDLVGDSLSRQILTMANDSPISATTLADRLDVSPPTVYRRLDELASHDFLKEHRRVDDGTHYRVFETTLHSITFTIEGENGFTVDVRLKRNLSDRFTGFWSEFEEASTDGPVGFSTSDEQPGAQDDPTPQ